VRFLRERLLQDGHACVVLNTGESRKIKSAEYEDIQNGRDFLCKLISYLSKGYLVHMHANGDSPKGFVLTIGTELISLLFGRRCILTFHAGAQQVYFPKERNRWLIPMFYLLFALPKVVICNSEAVKHKIGEYGITPEKVIPIPAFSKQYLNGKTGDLPPALTRFLQIHPRVLTTSIRFDPRYYVDVLLQAFAIVRKDYPDLGLVIAAPLEGVEEVKEKLTALGIAQDVCIAGDLAHEVFLTLFKHSTLYIRTPTTDGVSSSVMEALSLGLPVIASENGTRPVSVRTYPATDAQALSQNIAYALKHYAEVKASLQRPPIRDTVEEEAQLLIETFHGTRNHS
jgi:glycosyltransferase involved in cell wall biosynthesis